MSTDGGPVDPTLLDLFRAELETHVPVLSEGLLELEKDPTQTRRLEALMRAAHSIKGAARIVGVDAAVQVAHGLEDCFVAAQAGRIAFSSDAVDLLLRGVDLLTRVAHPSDDTPAEEISGLVRELTAIRDGKPPVRGPVGGGPPQVPGVRSLALPENLDRTAAAALRPQLGEFLREQVPVVRLDLAGVRTLDPAGLALLAGLARAAARSASPPALEVHNARPELAQLLRATGLHRAYQVLSSEGC